MMSTTGEWQRRPTEDVRPDTLLEVEAAPAFGYLVRLGGGDDAGQRIRVEQMLTIGREDGVDLQLRASDVSRQHARITRVASGDFILEDLDSRNGTLVNGQEVRMHVLRFGDTIHLGARSAFIFTHHNPAEQQLLEAERLDGVSQLAGGIAHHINNLLSVMLSNLGFVEDLTPDTPLGDELVIESFSDMRAAVGRASSIVRQLLSYARQRSQGGEEVDLSGLMLEVVAELRRRATGARVELDVEPGICFSGDETTLRSMIENLGDNALEATGGEGQVTLGARVRDVAVEEALRLGLPSVGPNIEVWVRDSGEGMDRETRERAFEPFFSTKGPTRGTGLGLAAVHGIVRAHGGHARVESMRGQGTTVWLYLPLPGARRHDSAERGGAVRRVQSDHIMVAAAPGLRERLQAAAVSRGRSLTMVGDARQLVMSFLEHRGDVARVLVDARLVDLSASDALRLLRRSETSLTIGLLMDEGVMAPAELDVDQRLSVASLDVEALAELLFGPAPQN